MRTLIIRDKYQSGIPENGLSPNESSLDEVLVNSGLLGEINVYYFDDAMHRVGQSAMCEQILLACAIADPDLVIFYAVGWEQIDPARTAIQAISKTMGYKVFLLRGDSVGKNGNIFNKSWFPFVNFIGFFDATLAHLGYGGNPKAIQGIPCCNPRFYYYDRKVKRNIEVSFTGSTSADKPHRAEYIEFLKNNEIGIVAAGGQYGGARTIPWKKYSSIMRRSKISLNFCGTSEGNSQLKGRVFEATACRTLLLEEEGTETKEFFEEGKDFVMFHSKEDLLEKVKYYLEHDEEREKIAKSGWWKTANLYNPRNAWGYILEKTGFEIPESLSKEKHYRELCAKLESQREGLYVSPKTGSS